MDQSNQNTFKTGSSDLESRLSQFELDSSVLESMGIKQVDLTITPRSLDTQIVVTVSHSFQDDRAAVVTDAIVLKTHGDMEIFTAALWKMIRPSILLDMSQKK